MNADQFFVNRRKPLDSETKCTTCKRIHRNNNKRKVHPPIVTYDFNDGKPLTFCEAHYLEVKEPYEPEPLDLVRMLR